MELEAAEVGGAGGRLRMGVRVFLPIRIVRWVEEVEGCEAGWKAKGRRGATE